MLDLGHSDHLHMAAHRNQHKILIIRLSSIGDILLTTPLLRILKKKYPHAQIDFIIKKQFMDIVRTNPHINTIYPLDTTLGSQALRQLARHLKSSAYDAVIDLHNNFRSRQLRKTLHTIGIIKKYKCQRFLLIAFKLNLYKKIIPVYQRYIDTARSLNVQDDMQGLEFHLDPLERQGVEKYCTALGYSSTRKTIGIAPGAGFSTKQYPIEKTIHVVKKLAASGDYQFFLLGNASERRLTDKLAAAVDAHCLNLAGDMTLMQTACAVDFCDVLLTNDSGLMHLANALNKRTISIFGPTVRELGFYPFGDKAVVIENNNLSCRPCTHMGRKNCPKKHFKCMLDIHENEVYSAMCKQLEETEV